MGKYWKYMFQNVFLQEPIDICMELFQIIPTLKKCIDKVIGVYAINNSKVSSTY